MGEEKPPRGCRFVSKRSGVEFEPNNNHHLENKLLLISINFTLKNQPQLPRKWYTRFCRQCDFFLWWVCDLLGAGFECKVVEIRCGLRGENELIFLVQNNPCWSSWMTNVTCMQKIKGSYCLLGGSSHLVTGSLS